MVGNKRPYKPPALIPFLKYREFFYGYRKIFTLWNQAVDFPHNFSDIFIPFSPVIQARILESSFNETLHERKYRVRVIKILKSAVDLKVREDIFVANDQCKCPKLELREQYVIMGTMVKVSITDTRLVIPSRPYVWKWRSRMEEGLKSITCDN